ncbi:MAG TPA: hypothetical protein VK815_01130 [Candidatus Acidoferrales bacterium]|jgi:hypothetical protein|nr:hypothetical protein [Candidatus Acidoferrales bacterium]
MFTGTLNTFVRREPSLKRVFVDVFSPGPAPAQPRLALSLSMPVENTNRYLSLIRSVLVVETCISKPTDVLSGFADIKV